MAQKTEGNVTREAVVRTGTEGLAQIAVEGAPAPGGGRYAGFGPWPTMGPGGVTAFIAALDDFRIACRLPPRGSRGNDWRPATMGETFPTRRGSRPFRAQYRRRGGTGRRRDFATIGARRERRAQRHLLPLSGTGALTWSSNLLDGGAAEILCFLFPQAGRGNFDAVSILSSRLGIRHKGRGTSGHRATAFWPGAADRG